MSTLLCMDQHEELFLIQINVILACTVPLLAFVITNKFLM